MSREGDQQAEPVRKRLNPTQVMRVFVTVLFGVLGAVGAGFAMPHLIAWLLSLTGSAEGRELISRSVEIASIAAGSLAGFIIGTGIGNLIWIGITGLLYRWDRMDTGDKVSLFLGVFVGLLAAGPFLFLFNGILPTVWVPVAVLGTTLGFTMLAVYMLQSMEEILPWTQKRGRGRRRGIKILDTNVIIDGRIADIFRSGFLEGQLYVPGFVLDELQYIADSADALRRQRGRRGLEVLKGLQNDSQLEVRNQDRLAPDHGDEVDARLVRLARAMGADIVTNDFNLNRVANLQGVRVLNVNDLALAVRQAVMPTEKLIITIVREGNQPRQGVGYLEDGTMVVVENGKPHIGETISVVVTQVIQTERGKMIFADIAGEDDFEDPPQMQGHPKKPLGPRKH